jgi:hypothetical protein
MTSESPSRGLNLARSNTLRFQSLEPKLTEIQTRRTFRNAVDTAFELLTELGLFRLQHDRISLPVLD